MPMQFEFLRDLNMPAGGVASAVFRIRDTARPAHLPVEERLTLEILSIGFEQRIVPGVYEALPAMEVVRDGALGNVLQRISARVRYRGEEYIWSYINQDRSYPIRATWNLQVAPGNAPVCAVLSLNIRDEFGLNHDILPVPAFQPKNTNYQAVGQTNEEDRGVYFDGRRLFNIRARTQQFRVNARGRTRPYVAENFVPTIPRHEGREVIFAQPFVDPQDNMPIGGYLGRYLFHGTLQSQFKYPHLNVRSLIYSNGRGEYFLPHVTQESWRRDQNTLVRFLIASFRPQDAMFFVPGARMDNGHHQFGEGLYQLLSVEESPQERVERWARVEQDLRPGTHQDTVVTVRTLAGVSAFPGMGNGQLEQLGLPQGAGIVPVIQDGMRQIEDYLRGFRGLEDSAFRVIIGPAGSGKSTLVHLIANEVGRQLRVSRHPEGRREHIFEPDQELPGIAIGHRVGVVGTTRPAPWINRVRNEAYWDTNGLGDPRTIGQDQNLLASQDILNAYTINKLTSGRRNVKFFLTVPEIFMLLENERGRRFLEIVDQFAHSFPDGNAWHEGCCLVVTHGLEYPDHKVVIRRLLETPQGQNVFLDRPRVRSFLEYLAAHGHEGERVVSFRKPGFFNLQLGDRYPDLDDSGCREEIIRCIEGTGSLHNPIFRLAVSSDVREITRGLADQINQSLVHFMNTQVIQKLRDYFFAEIKRPQSVATLRNTLRNRLDGINVILRDFDGLGNIPFDAPDAEQRSVRVVSAVLNQLFGLQANANNNQWLNSTTANDLVRQLNFLRTLNNTVRFETAAWTADFQRFVQRLLPLSDAPRNLNGNFDQATHTLSFSGGFIYGTSDINRALALQPKANINHIVLPCTNAVIIDEDISDPRLAGGSVNIFSPLWVINGERTIDLGGRPGANAGAAGQNGGIMIGKAAKVIGANQLTVKLNGGNGAQGAQGAQGAPGADGANEEYPPALEVQQANPGGPADWNHRFIGVGGDCRFGKIKVRHGALVDALEFIARAGRSDFVSFGRRGGGGGSETTINFAPDEYLTGVRGEKGGRGDLKKLWFITNRREYGPYGTCGGHTFTKNKNGEITCTQLSFNNEVTILEDIKIKHGGVSRRIRDRTFGAVGGTGAVGNNGGNGGQAGIFSVEGLEFAALNADSTCISGAGGPGGNGGPGGLGGLHGKLHGETTDSRAAAGGRGPQGAAGVPTQGAQMTDAALNALKEQRRMLYAFEYWQTASQAQTAQLVRSFPGLPRPQPI